MVQSNKFLHVAVLYPVNIQRRIVYQAVSGGRGGGKEKNS